MAVLRAIGQIIVKDLTVHIRYPANAVCLLLRPVLGFLPFLLMSRHLVAAVDIQGIPDSSGFIICGFLVWTLLLNTMISASLFVRTEAAQGTMETLLATRTSVLTLFTGHLAGSTVRELANFGIGLIIAVSWFRLRLDPGRLIAGWGVLVISLACVHGMGMVLGAVTLLAKRPRYSFMVLAIIGFLACPTYPVTVLPPVLRLLVYANPLTFALDLSRGLLLGASTIMPAARETALLASLSVLSLGAGYAVLTGAVRRMRVAGSSARY